jgi:AcrR family transcriptional regulator
MAKRAMTAEAKALKAHAILDKAAEMFSNSEYEKIKMTDIAKEMNMSNGILFVYFKTKESLFFSLLVREYEKRLARLTELAKGTTISEFYDFKKLKVRLQKMDIDPTVRWLSARYSERPDQLSR